MRSVLDFETAWQKLAAESLVVETDDATYRRLFAAWQAAYQPEDVEQFLRERVGKAVTP